MNKLREIKAKIGLISKQPSMEHGLLLEGHNNSENTNEFDFKRQSPTTTLSNKKMLFSGKALENTNHKVLNSQNSEQIGQLRGSNEF